VSEREGVCVCICCNVEFFVIIAESSWLDEFSDSILLQKVEPNL
jgi:hypothetical protein